MRIENNLQLVIRFKSEETIQQEAQAFMLQKAHEEVSKLNIPKETVSAMINEILDNIPADFCFKPNWEALFNDILNAKISEYYNDLFEQQTQTALTKSEESLKNDLFDKETQVALARSNASSIEFATMEKEKPNASSGRFETIRKCIALKHIIECLAKGLDATPHFRSEPTPVLRIEREPSFRQLTSQPSLNDRVQSVALPIIARLTSQSLAMQSVFPSMYNNGNFH